MRKILSFVAAMFVALAVNAQELPSTDFAAPGYSCAADAAVLSGTATELSGKFYLDETASPHHIAWSDLSKQYTAVATWHFHASRACYVTVTLDLGPVIASNKHIFDVELHAANGDRLDTIAEGPNYTGDGFTEANVQKTLEGQILIPAAGDYYIELRNNRDWCKGSIKNVILTYAADAPVIGAPAYYLVGTMNNWTPDEAYKFEENPGAEGEYMLTAALTVGDEIKVKGIVGATETWYPAGTGNNYVVDADHAGEWKKIYFRPEGQGGEDWHYGFFFVEENPEPQPVVGTHFVKVTEAPADWAGEYLIVFETADTVHASVAMNGGLAAFDAVENGVAVTIENDKIAVSEALLAAKFTIAAMNGGYSIKGASGKFIGAASYSNSLLTSDTAIANVLSIGNDSNAVIAVNVMNNTTPAQVTMRYNYANNQLRFRYYKSGQQPVALYKLTTIAPEPQPQGCDWDNIEFLGDGSSEQTYANQFKVCKDGDVPTVVNIQTPGFATGTGIYMTFPDAVIGNISLDADQYKIEGAGVIFYLTAFTAKETEVTVQWQNGVYSFTVLNVNGTEPQPEVNYSLKNNWDAAADWTWKEMTKDGETYKLENVVFGGTGVNYQADLPGAPEMWVPMADFLGDKVDAKDTVTFVLNPADSTITATLIGKYIEPQPEMTVIYNWAKDSADQVGATIFGGNSNITTGTVKIHENTDDVNGIKFGSSYVYADGKWIAIKPAEGGFKAGDVLSVSVVFNNSDATKYCMVDLRAADGDTRIWMSDSLSTLNGRNAGNPIVQTYTLEADQDSLFLGRYGNTGMFVTLLKVDRAVAPEPVHTYTVAGAPATLFGTEWNPEMIANDLEPIVGGEYTHGWKKDSVALAAGKVEFKIVEDHAWTHAWPAQNYELPIAENAIYNIAIFFNDQTKAVYAEATKVGDLPLPEGITCDSVYNLAKNDTAALAPVVVTYVNGKNVYVMDATAGMLLYLPANGTWKIGDQLTGVEGVVDIYNGIYEVKLNAAQVAAVTADSGAVPQPVKVDSVTMKDMSKFILVEGIEFDTDTAFVEGKQANITIVVAGDSIVLRNNFKNGYAFEAGKKYNISALVTLYSGKLQLYFVTAEEQATIAYYVAGSMNGWAANEAYMLTPNNESLYEGEFTFAANDEFKVIGFNGKTTTWYPDGMGNNFKITEAGDYKITFNPAGNVEGWYAGFFNVVKKEEPVAPTTAPAAPTAAEDDVMAIYCNHYATNNLHFEILGWGGVTTWHADTIDGVAIVHCQDMKYEFLTNWGAASYDMSAYKKLHADLWAPAASTIRLGIEALGVNDGGSGFKSGVVCTLAEGWNSIDIEFSQVPDLANYSFTDVKYIFFEWYKTPEGESFENNPFGFANIYFYDKKAEGFENIDASMKAVKVLQNGQIFILRGDKVYTVTGQPVK